MRSYVIFFALVAVLAIIAAADLDAEESRFSGHHEGNLHLSKGKTTHKHKPTHHSHDHVHHNHGRPVTHPARHNKNHINGNNFFDTFNRALEVAAPVVEDTANQYFAYKTAELAIKNPTPTWSKDTKKHPTPARSKHTKINGHKVPVPLTVEDDDEPMGFTEEDDDETMGFTEKDDDETMGFTEEDDDETTGFTEEDDDKVTVPSTEEDDDKVTVPSTVEDDDKLTVPSTVEDDDKLTVPSTVEDGDETEGSTGEDFDDEIGI